MDNNRCAAPGVHGDHCLLLCGADLAAAGLTMEGGNGPKVAEEVTVGLPGSEVFSFFQQLLVFSLVALHGLEE